MNEENEVVLSEKKSVAVARDEYISEISDKIESLINNEKFKPSDIMILVQRRHPFAAPLINQLKLRGIDVAGSDRVILPQFPAIRDFMNLIRFCIDNSDDYSLCCTLRSPIYSLTQDDILKICSIRNDLIKSSGSDNKNTVFDVLKNTHPEIHSDLETIIEWSKIMAPYSFFSRILTNNKTREKMISDMGNQIIDPLEEFLTICLSYERTQPGTMRHFLKWFITGGSEIKRDMDAASGVRIVTVHGSKGLESPVVFLIDTMRTPMDKPDRIIPIKDDLNIWLWSPKVNESEKFAAAASENMKIKMAEYYRLLYVAMTRARDRLYIYGFSSTKKPNEVAWHTQLFNILSNVSDAKNDGKTIRIS